MPQLAHSLCVTPLRIQMMVLRLPWFTTTRTLTIVTASANASSPQHSLHQRGWCHHRSCADSCSPGSDGYTMLIISNMKGWHLVHIQMRSHPSAHYMEAPALVRLLLLRWSCSDRKTYMQHCLYKYCSCLEYQPPLAIQRCVDCDRVIQGKPPHSFENHHREMCRERERERESRRKRGRERGREREREKREEERQRLRERWRSIEIER